MSLSMFGHVSGDFQSVPATRTNHTGGVYVDGIWTPGAGAQTSHVVNIQPMSDKEIDFLRSGGERIKSAYRVYINDGSADYALAESDTWEFTTVDGVFRTISMDNRPWRDYVKLIVSLIDD